MKKRINITINDYKEYSEIYSSIEIEIKPVINKYGKFINITDINNIHYHIYFNDYKEEIKRNHINNDEQIKIVKIIIDFQVKSFKELFKDSECIECINFTKFHRNNIDNMSFMFSKCHKLREIKGINQFITNKVTNMQQMFNECSELESLNLSNFDTSNVTNMAWMFEKCNKLKYLNLSNFSIKGETEGMLTFKKDNCNFITNNNDLLNLYKSS